MGCDISTPIKRQSSSQIKGSDGQPNLNTPTDIQDISEHSSINLSNMQDSFLLSTTSLANLTFEAAGIANAPSFFNPQEKPQIFEYKFLQHIGHGSSSDVFLVTHVTNEQQFAAKVYDKSFLFRTTIGDSEQPIHRVIREIQIMSILNHPNVIPLVEILDDECTNSLVIVIPFADKGPLSKKAWKSDRLEETECQRIFCEIAKGLQYLHSHNIIHRDLKPDNVLLFNNGGIRIADFSVSIELEDPDQPLEDTDGTPAFYSPEECMGEPYLGKPADVWAFGMMLYVMIFGKLPFFDSDDEGALFAQFFQISQKILDDPVYYPEDVIISEELQDLFSHLLDKDPKTRYTIDEACQHPWLSK